MTMRWGALSLLTFCFLSLFSCRNAEPQTFYQRLRASVDHPLRRWLAAASASPIDSAAVATDDQPLQQTYWFAGHNTYRHSDVHQSLQAGMRAIEIDISDDQAPPGDWRVCHTNLLGRCSLPIRGTLSEQLRAIRRFHDHHPRHQPIHVFIDKKNEWTRNADNHTIERFDELLAAELDRQNLWTPAKFKGTAPSARWQALHGQWPTTGSLRGKIVVVLTSGDISVHGSNSTLREYVGVRGYLANAFVSPSIRAGQSCTDTSTLGGGWDDGNAANATGGFVVFYNFRFGEAVSEVHNCRALGLMSRIWFSEGDEDSEQDSYFSALIDRAGANFVAIRDHRKLLAQWHRGRPNGVFLR